MSKLLFFDIDGTLIECNLGIYSITDSTKQALDELKQNGHDVFLATGRCKCFITDGVMSYPFSGRVMVLMLNIMDNLFIKQLFLVKQLRQR